MCHILVQREGVTNSMEIVLKPQRKNGKPHAHSCIRACKDCGLILAKSECVNTIHWLEMLGSLVRRVMKLLRSVAESSARVRTLTRPTWPKYL